MLEAGDTILVAELSRLGRNMFETLNLVNAILEKGVKLIFVRQPELSTDGPHGQLLLAIYGHFAQTERDYISLRTKQGLACRPSPGKSAGQAERKQEQGTSA